MTDNVQHTVQREQEIVQAVSNEKIGIYVRYSRGQLIEERRCLN